MIKIKNGHNEEITIIFNSYDYQITLQHNEIALLPEGCYEQDFQSDFENGWHLCNAGVWSLKESDEAGSDFVITHASEDEIRLLKKADKEYQKLVQDILGHGKSFL